MTPGWVSDTLGLQLLPAPDSPQPLDALVEVALRRNPRRAHLLVSTVLGKHVPTDPRRVFDAAAELGRAVASALAGEPATVLGYAETATGLGHVVAETLFLDGLGAGYLHSTRRRVAGIEPVAGFEESHSHATSHLLLPEVPALLDGPEPLVLVDDELSTGRTALNTIAALHARSGRRRYLLAALVDLRGAADHALLDAAAARMGISIEVVALARGGVEVPAAFPVAAAALVATTPAAPRCAQSAVAPREVSPRWPAIVRDGGRHGFGAGDVPAARGAARATAAELAAGLAGDRVLVLATEELMYAPLLIALALADAPGRQVRYSSTTRSPVVALDLPGYPIRTALRFPAHDADSGTDSGTDADSGTGSGEGAGERYAYNVAPAAGETAPTDIVVVVDSCGDTPALRAPGGLLDQLGSVSGRVHLVVLPSYRPAAVRA